MFFLAPLVLSVIIIHHSGTFVKCFMTMGTFLYTCTKYKLMICAVFTR
nr:MAG TPA: hypothetical protein [Caudoviricetes sp.]